MAESTLSSTKLNEIQNHDDFKVIWLSLDTNVPNELTYFIDYLEKFNSFETCDNYIKKFKSERKIFLVLTCFFDRLSYFNDLPQIQSIYVLETNSQNVKQNYSKLVNIFTDEHELIEQLRRDILLTYRNDFSINTSCLDEIKTEQSLLSLDKNTFMFLWNQLFIYYLVNSPDMNVDQLKKDMIKQCQLEYEDNKTQLKHINDFNKDCTPDNVLNWYTKDLFFYRIINKAFRKRNIDLICKFRYFITLLYNKLKELSIKQQGENYMTVYRGQILGENDLENLQSNIGHLISTNTFMSTTRKEDIARRFIIGAEVGVIFEINTASASNNNLHPFADISQFSSIKDEEEILFFPGAVFRIDSVKKEDDSTWIIKLILTNETVEQIEQIMNGIEQKLNSKTHWHHLFIKTDDIHFFRKYYRILTEKKISWKDMLIHIKGVDLQYLISALGNYKKAIEFYEQLLLNEKFIDHPKFIVLNIIIGYNYSHLSEYDNALSYYNIALSLLDPNNRLTGELYIHIGDVWRVKNKFESALLCYEQALQILTDHGVSNYYIAIIYRKMSDIYRKDNKDEEANIYEIQADHIDENFRTRSELDNQTSLKYFQDKLNTELDFSPLQRADILFSIGLCLMKKSDYSQALHNFLQAKKLFENHLPSCDKFVHTFATLFENMAWAYLMLNDKFNALIMLKKAIDIRLSFTPK